MGKACSHMEKSTAGQIAVDMYYIIPSSTDCV